MPANVYSQNGSFGDVYKMSTLKGHRRVCAAESLFYPFLYSDGVWPVWALKNL